MSFLLPRNVKVTVLDVFTTLRWATIRFVMYARKSAWNISASTGRIFIKFNTWGNRENLSRKLKFPLKLDKSNGYFHDDLYTFMLVSVWIFLGIENDGRCTREIKSRISVAKAAFSKKNNLFTRKLDLNLRQKLIKCYIWSMALYGAETWTLRAADQKYLESF